MFWGWLRKKLCHMDLEDLRKKRQLMDKAGYTARVKSIMRSQKAQSVAKSYAAGLRKTCRQVESRGGAAADN